MPKPNPGETKSDFIARCVPYLVDEGKDREQAVAICHSLWDPEFKELTSEARNKLDSSAFVFPKERRYPIHDRAHAANALARASGKAEWDRVRAAV